MAQSIENSILSRVYGHGMGWAFTPSHFLDLGSYGAVALALKKLCDNGKIRRLARGLYDYPRMHPKLGELAATPEQRDIVKSCGRRVELGGGLVESEAVLEDDSLNDIGQQFLAV